MPDLIKVGEALFSVDPLSSQGVQTALGTALHAAAVVNTALRRSEDREIAEQFYRERQQEAVAFHCSTAAQLYGQVALEREAPFWQDRAGKVATEQEGTITAYSMRVRKPPTGKGRIQLAAETQIFPMPCVEEDFIVKRQAVRPPGRVRPTVFLGDVAVAPLLESLRAPLTVQETLRIWSQKIHRNQVGGVLNWLFENGAIVEVG